MYIHIIMCVYIYIYIYAHVCIGEHTANLQTEIPDFRGFGSSIILILWVEFSGP